MREIVQNIENAAFTSWLIDKLLLILLIYEEEKLQGNIIWSKKQVIEYQWLCRVTEQLYIVRLLKPNFFLCEEELKYLTCKVMLFRANDSFFINMLKNNKIKKYKLSQRIAEAYENLIPISLN